MESILNQTTTLFVAGTSGDDLWDLYLESFPEGTNSVFRERRGHDCSCCKQFIRQFGNVVAILDGKMVSIWDFDSESDYQPSLDAMSALLHSGSVSDIFMTKTQAVGTVSNLERTEDGVRTWEHLHVSLPSHLVSNSGKTVPEMMAQTRDVKNVFVRSLNEISEGSIETVLDLIAQKSLYKGDEWQGALQKFLALHNEYHSLLESEMDLWAWVKAVEIGGTIGKIKNHSIGVLLIDISNGVIDLNEAVRKYEAIVAPRNYKRPKATFTEKMVMQAEQTLTDLGLLESLGRRHATIDDITVNNIVFANRDATNQMSGGVFDDLIIHDATPARHNFDRVEEISVEHFVEHVLPRATDVSVLVENRMAPNLVSLIAPTKDSPSLFKWSNGFSWAYSGNITDSSMKERVKAAGGNVGGVLRFSLQWNEGGDNQNDFDAHCREPNGDHIYYPNKGARWPSTGMLDVDIIHPGRDQIAVENITWDTISKMDEGIYELHIHNYEHRGGRSGFSAEIEFDGQVHSYEYNKELQPNDNVMVAKVALKDGKFEIFKSLPSSLSSKEIWGVQTNQFHPVSVAMFSPNFWDGQMGIGHKHYFFILAGCRNEDQPNGFFNEFLREEFMPYRRVFEALGSKMKVAQANSQLSGIGFSSTKRNSLVVKLEGHTKRVLRVVF